MSTIWTVCYTKPSRYNWMLQFYLRAEGLALSWIGTGRIIFSLNYREEEFEAVASRFIAAVRAMQGDCWWWEDASVPNPQLNRQILREMIGHLLGARNSMAASGSGANLSHPISSG
jgi:glutamate-1-semialdehyde 2,1-aminomutase